MKAHRYLSLALTGALLLAAGGCGAGGNSSGAAPAADMAAPAAGSAVYANAGAPAEAQEGLPEFYTEEYRYLAENGFHAVSTAPLSTFAADVDTASYANLRRMLLSGQEVPAEGRRALLRLGRDRPLPLERRHPPSAAGAPGAAAGLGGHAPLQPGFSHRRVRLYGEL